MEKSRPHVILSAAMTIDGKIATKTGDSELSSKKDKKRVHKLRAKTDAILVGINTVIRDDPLLSLRHAQGNNPIRVILDSKGTISSKSKIIKTCSKIPTIIAVSKMATRQNIQRLGKYPIEIFSSGDKKINIKKLLKFLLGKKIRRILLEGGGTVNWEFISQDLVDEIIITITPFVVGGKNAISLVEGDGFSLVSKSKKFNLKKTTCSGNELILFYTK
jgi:2,5-diamino-6-(ribosylamino)-4(3H)-pyrimidinone 5'-phosphate reductase